MREWIRQYRPAILTLVVSSLIAACNQQPAAQSAPLQAAPPPCKLSVGWDPWEPYQYADTDGEIRGLDIEILELLAADAGCDVQVHGTCTPLELSHHSACITRELRRRRLQAVGRPRQPLMRATFLACDVAAAAGVCLNLKLSAFIEVHAPVRSKARHLWAVAPCRADWR